MSISVLTAVTAAAGEASLIATLERASGLQVMRRCVDVSDLQTAALAGHGSAAFVSADLRDLDREALGRLLAAGVAPVGVAGLGDEDGERRLRQLGIDHVVVASAEAADVLSAVEAAVAALAAPIAGLDPVAAVNEAFAGHDPATAEAAAPGRLIAVWGPTGAPGRTTIAANLAAEFAAMGRASLLADVDTYGGATAQVLGLLDESPGIAAAARAANAGHLDLPGLARIARQITPRLRILTGIARTERWPELRPSSLDVVWQLARGLAQFIVVDCGFCLEDGEERGYDAVAPRRNGATLSAIGAADVVVVVGAADPVGLNRLVRGLAAVDIGDADIRVVVNRVRDSVLGKNAERQVKDALHRYAGLSDVAVIPEDRPAVDGALAAGQLLVEAAPTSPARVAIQGIAADVAAAQAVHPRT
jgi:MinD-like ATPase involved in chromosome partitioning or flagellar assembly